MFALSDGTLRP